jgi:hypothetical protein
LTRVSTPLGGLRREENVPANGILWAELALRVAKAPSGLPDTLPPVFAFGRVTGGSASKQAAIIDGSVASVPLASLDRRRVNE